MVCPYNGILTLQQQKGYSIDINNMDKCQN